MWRNNFFIKLSVENDLRQTLVSFKPHIDDLVHTNQSFISNGFLKIYFINLQFL